MPISTHSLRILFHIVCLVMALSVVSAAQTSHQNNIAGMVKDISGAALQGAIVRLLDARQFEITTASTDAQGRFTLGGVTQGSFELLITYRGFAPRR